MRHVLRLSHLAFLSVLLASAGAGAEQQAPMNEAAPVVTVEPTKKQQQAAEANKNEALERAAAASADLERLNRELLAASDAARATEVAILTILDRLEALQKAEREAEEALAQRLTMMQPVLPVLLRASSYPTQTLLAAPGTPEDRVRGQLLLRGIATRLNHEAADLVDERERLRVAQTAVAAETNQLNAAKANQQKLTDSLEILIADASTRRDRARSEAGDAAQRAADLAAAAENLRAALAKLEEERKKEQAEANKRAKAADQANDKATAATARQVAKSLAPTVGTLNANDKSKGQLTTPVSAKTSRRFQPDPADSRSYGLSFATAPKARVVAPCNGKIAFANHFQNHGQLLIIDCGGQHHVVLSGLNRIDLKVGNMVKAGEPVGIMPDGNQRPTLYLELRKNGDPIDPAPWLPHAE